MKKLKFHGSCRRRDFVANKSFLKNLRFRFQLEKALGDIHVIKESMVEMESGLSTVPDLYHSLGAIREENLRHERRHK